MEIRSHDETLGYSRPIHKMDLCNLTQGQKDFHREMTVVVFTTGDSGLMVDGIL